MIIKLKQNLFGGIDMHKMTEKNLRDAFSGESEAHMKYLIFADVAEQEGKPNIARLFRAIASAEKVHANQHLKVIGGISSTEDNLREALNGENFEVNEMYPAYNTVAEIQGEKSAQRAINYALEAEGIHAAMYEKAVESAAAGDDIEIGKIYVCPTCGHTTEDLAPDRCPICGVSGEKFKEF